MPSEQILVYWVLCVFWGGEVVVLYKLTLNMDLSSLPVSGSQVADLQVHAALLSVI